MYYSYDYRTSSSESTVREATTLVPTEPAGRLSVSAAVAGSGWEGGTQFVSLRVGSQLATLS